jgi:hypothetical protein
VVFATIALIASLALGRQRTGSGRGARGGNILIR